MPPQKWGMPGESCVSCFTLENFFRPADRPGCGPLSLGIALRRPPSVPRDRRGRRTARCCAARRDGSGDRAARPGPPGEGAAKRCDPPRDAASLRRLPPADVLEEGLHKMAEIAQALADLAVTDRSMIWNTDLVEALELDNPIGQAAVVASFRPLSHREPLRAVSRGSPQARRRELAQAYSGRTRRCRPSAARCVSTRSPTRPSSRAKRVY